MFSFTDSVADDQLLSRVSSMSAGEFAREMQRRGRQADARALLLAYRIGLGVFEDFIVNPARQKNIRNAADKAAVGEVSLQLKISRARSGKWISLGEALQKLDDLRIAFLDGEFSIPRTQVIAEHLMILDDELRAEAQPLALTLARRDTLDDTLRADLEALIIALDPDAAAAAREEFADRNQDVKVSTDSFGHANIDATVPAEDGVFLKKKLAAMRKARVCKHDPRPPGKQRVVALAELLGVPGKQLVCECGQPECGLRAAAPVPDVAPNAQPAENQPGPDLFDQAALDAAIPLSSRATDADKDAAPTDAESPALVEPAQVPDPELSVVVDPTGSQPPRLQEHGPIDPAHAEALADTSTALTLPPGLVVVGDRLAPPVDPTGHGGFTDPPPGALVYRPSKLLRDQILLQDLRCRYPLCNRPAHECELDHLVKFTHADPRTGGWTVGFNLAPLCGADHERKHLGLWIPTMLTDRTIVWRNPQTGQEIITYPR